MRRCQRSRPSFGSRACRLGRSRPDFAQVSPQWGSALSRRGSRNLEFTAKDQGCLAVSIRFVAEGFSEQAPSTPRSQLSRSFYPLCRGGVLGTWKVTLKAQPKKKRFYPLCRGGVLGTGFFGGGVIGTRLKFLSALSRRGSRNLRKTSTKSHSLSGFYPLCRGGVLGTKPVNHSSEPALPGFYPLCRGGVLGTGPFKPMA